MTVGYRTLARNRNFGLIWLGQTASQFGDTFHDLTLIWVALSLSQQNYWSIGLVISAKFLPYLFFGLLGGVYSDRWDRKRVMIICDVLRGLIVLLLLLLSSLGLLALWHLAVISFLLTTLRAFFQPALQASVAQVVPEQHIVSANSILFASYHAAAVLGPVAAGFLYGRLSAGGMFLIDSATFFVSALAIIFVRLPHVQSSAQQINIRQDLGDTISTLRQRPTVLWPIVFSALGILVVAGILRLGLPAFVTEALDGGSDVYGLLMGAMGLGTVLGALLIGRLQDHSHTAVLFGGWVVYGLLLGSIGLTTWVPLALAIALLTGVAGALIDVMIISVIQLNTPQHQMGKVLAFFSTLANMGESVAGVLMGGLLALFSATPVLLASGILTALIGGTGLVAVRQPARTPDQPRGESSQYFEESSA